MGKAGRAGHAATRGATEGAGGTETATAAKATETARAAEAPESTRGTQILTLPSAPVTNVAARPEAGATDQYSATGLPGEPVPPLIFSGDQTNRNS